MASTYSALKIELIGTGEQSGTWGATTNINLGDAALGEAITGSATVDFASAADVTISLIDTNTTQVARNLRLNITESGAGIGYTGNLILGSNCQIEKLYLVNNTTTATKTIKNTTGTGIAIPAGKSMFVFNNAVNVVEAVNSAISMAVTGAVSGSQLTSTVATGTAPLVVASTTPVANLSILGNATNITGTLAVAQGGTGAAAVTGSGNNVLSTSPTLVTPILGTPTSGNLANCTGYPAGSITGTVNLTTQVTGTLPVANGGTGVTTSTGTGSVVLSTSPTFSNRITNYGINTNAATSAGITGGTSAGTLAVPLQTPTATSIFKIAPLGYTGSAWTGGSSLDFVTTDAITSVNRGTSVVLNAIAAGGGTATALTWNGTTLDANGTTLTGNTGTVTSVSASVPAFLSIAGSPITTTGTLAITYSGTALPVANGGTGVTSSSGTGSVVLNSSPSLTTPTIGGGGANFSGSTSGTTNFKAAAAAGTTTITMPATTGTMALTSDIPTVNNATLTMGVSGTGLSGSQTFTANQSSAATFTVTSNATNANTASTIVARDASGNFSAGTITAALTGNASTATTATSANNITNSGGWSVTPSGTKLYFNYNGTNVASLDSSGNLITLANITAYGTP